MDWQFEPICLTRGNAYALVEEGYVGYGVIGGAETVERISHFAPWFEMEDELAVVQILYRIVTMLDVESDGPQFVI